MQIGNESIYSHKSVCIYSTQTHFCSACCSAILTYIKVNISQIVQIVSQYALLLHECFKHKCEWCRVKEYVHFNNSKTVCSQTIKCQGINTKPQVLTKCI